MVRKFSNIKKIDPIEPVCRKPIYNSMEEAQDMVKYIRENRIVKEIHPYKCTVCGFWHLTSHQKN
jgi:biotin synthase-related radical SAM superfamily protein